MTLKDKLKFMKKMDFVEGLLFISFILLSLVWFLIKWSLVMILFLFLADWIIGDKLSSCIINLN